MAKALSQKSLKAANPLTVERLRELVSYDPETGIFRSRVQRGRHRVGATLGGTTEHGYINITIDRILRYAHRLAWLYMTGAWPTKAHIDHINGNRADNRWVNLREAHHGQNLMNRGPARHNTSGYKGVSKRRGKWVAFIAANKVQRCIGRYASKEEAARAYVEAAREAHGEFAPRFSPSEPKS